MKNALSLACMLLVGILLSTSGFAQSNTLFNPDYNGDGFIGVDDILGALSFYDNAWDGPVSPSWSCGEAITYAGVGYSTVQIGDQCWFAENLRTTTYLNGDAIPQNLSDGDWSSTTSGAMAFYDNFSTSSGLYNWYAVDDARGLCPSGWHVPTDEEWTMLTDHLGGESVAGGQMKTNYGWNGGGNGTNSSGFSGLPGGIRDFSAFFYLAGNEGYWWSSSPNGSNAWIRYLANSYEVVFRAGSNPQTGFSVRCVRDAE
ncbi:MAG: fibrobacter succinogenes major paralogous domain-containing protein [Flavobacteriales bacterium]